MLLVAGSDPGEVAAMRREIADLKATMTEGMAALQAQVAALSK